MSKKLKRQMERRNAKEILRDMRKEGRVKPEPLGKRKGKREQK